MAKRPRKTQKSQVELQDFAVVAFTEEMEEARNYETLLKNNEIPVIIHEKHEQSMNINGIAVMVPEDYIDEAHVIIESQNAYDDFYDLALEDDADFSSELFDEEF